MTRFTLTASLLIGFGLAMAGSPASAGNADDSWAACIWEQAPTSANNWLAMSVDKSDKWEKPNRYALLAARLQGFCRKALARPGKKGPPSFDMKGVRAVLQSSRPAVIGPDRTASDAIRCAMLIGNDILVGVIMGFGDSKGLKPVPPVTALKCQRIQDDGSLKDA